MGSVLSFMISDHNRPPMHNMEVKSSMFTIDLSFLEFSWHFGMITTCQQHIQLSFNIFEVFTLCLSSRQLDAFEDQDFLLSVLDGIFGRILKGFHWSDKISDVHTPGFTAFWERLVILDDLPFIYHHFCHQCLKDMARTLIALDDFDCCGGQVRLFFSLNQSNISCSCSSENLKFYLCQQQERCFFSHCFYSNAEWIFATEFLPKRWQRMVWRLSKSYA